MALTDTPSSRDRKPKNRSVAAGTNVQWSDKQKTEAVTSWLLLGNLAMTSRLLSIPEITLRVWKTTEWWKTLVEEIKTQENIQMSGRLKKIVDASLTAVEDRLVNGDWVYDNKTGQMMRKQVAMKDAHKVSTDLMDRQQALEKAIKPVSVEEQNDDKLLKLAEKFALMATQSLQKKPELEILEDITDVEIVQEVSR